MGGHLHVMAAADYARWLEQARVAGSLAERGANLFRSLGCSGCHGTSATVRAPQLEGLFGRPVALASGEVVTADEQYLRDSILLPQAQITAGYAPIMPTYRNLIGEDGVLALVAYIKSLGSSPRPAPP
jgi:cytochrome c oxidase subunit 2